MSPNAETPATTAARTSAVGAGSNQSLAANRRSSRMARDDREPCAQDPPTGRRAVCAEAAAVRRHPLARRQEGHVRTSPLDGEAADLQLERAGQIGELDRRRLTVSAAHRDQ